MAKDKKEPKQEEKQEEDIPSSTTWMKLKQDRINKENSK